jgi:hypothetical protein
MELGDARTVEGERLGANSIIGVSSMCDYSLEHIAFRPARVGDKLISTSFRNSSTRGFAALDEPDVAICLLPGTELAFADSLQCEAAYGFSYKRLPHKVARFCHVNKDRPGAHHDALELPDGEIVLLTKLARGQHASVLQMPASPRAIASEPEPRDAALVS